MSVLILLILAIAAAAFFYAVYCKKRINKSVPAPIDDKKMEDSSAAICINDPIFIELDYEKSVIFEQSVPVIEEKQDKLTEDEVDVTSNHQELNDI